MTANPTQGAEPFEGPAAIQCPYCAGSGSVGVYSDDGSPQQCGECQGEGLIGDRRAAPPPPVNASAIDAWKAAEEIHEAVVALSWARDGDFVPAVAAIILRHSAAPGLRLTGWRDISDEAKNGKDVLLRYERTPDLPEPWPLVIIAHWSTDGPGYWVWQTRATRGYGVQPVQWMPLPADRLAPTGPTQEEK